MSPSTPENATTKNPEQSRFNAAKYIWLFGVIFAFSFVFLIWTL